MDIDPSSSLDMDLMSSGMVESLDLFKDEDALTIIKEMMSPGKKAPTRILFLAKLTK